MEARWRDGTGIANESGQGGSHTEKHALPPSMKMHGLHRSVNIGTERRCPMPHEVIFP